ncbi:MAG: right-handed parallel beta-helix repeat-containing protein [Candidatus Heimdallarchaeota archaeon]|nr:right-handed parallel beta-helix repeat-containing protein [Candidatus Heimdallarchaeota archaeon]MCK4876061.1 right-handed parallel beta-helix repeat-containing protein [Candidatus Heimdallarchaeota archaeon]
MKIKTKKIILPIILILSLIAGFIFTNTHYLEANVDEKDKFPSFSNLTDYPSIAIYNDSELISYGFPGSGTENEPYRIEYLNITTSDYNGIDIENVTLHYVIQHCFISAWGRGIMIVRSSPGVATIYNNTITGHTYEAMEIFLSLNATVTENRCEKNGGSGIVLSWSAGAKIINNICTLNDRNAISIQGNSSDCFIYNNTLEHNYNYGIRLYDNSDNSTIYHNTFINNNLAQQYGPSQAADDSYGTLWYNATLQEGNWWWDWNGIGAYSIGGTAGTSDIYPLRTPVTPPSPHDPIYIDSDDDFITYGFEGTGAPRDPYRIEYLEIISTTNTSGILIKDVTMSFIIQYCSIDALQYGILVSNVPSFACKIYDTLIENTHFGIFVNYSHSAWILDNTCSFNNYSIIINECDESLIAGNECLDSNNKSISIKNSEDAYVVYNYCFSGNEEGIKLKDSPYSTVSHNLCLQNGYYAAMELLGYGIRILSSSHTIVKNNTCSENFESGISVNTGSFYTVEDNTCVNNEYTGIETGGADSSLISNNTCTGNPYGILLYSASSSTIRNNTCSSSMWAGMSMFEVTLCEFFDNIIEYTTNYGMEFSYLSSDNNIHHNKFIQNNLGSSSQAYDEGSNNVWYDTSLHEGNYWDDYSLVGSYSIDGSAGSEDPYPLNEQGIPYIPEYTVSMPLVFAALILSSFMISIVVRRRKTRR